MRGRFVMMALAVAMVAPLAAQAPEGWQVRIDHSKNAQDPDDVPQLKVAPAGKGFRVTGGPAGTFWRTADNATGAFTAKATFTLMQPSNHVNYYGLIFGGSDLGAPSQTYLYFVVAQNGTFQIRHRSGETAMNVQGRTPNAAIKQPDSAGRSTNLLEVRVGADTISSVVNGTIVHTTPKTGMTMKTDGLVGVRVNHMLDVQIEGLEVQRST
jgi:hypothetical protein